MKKSALILTWLLLFAPSAAALAQSAFNPNFIISDEEMLAYNIWQKTDVQKFLDSQASYLRAYSAPDYDGVVKPAADIIYDAALEYRVNPKYLLVTLQKEQSLITTDSPTQKQLDWAAGYGVCDSCALDDPKVAKYKGFGKQVENAAGIMRWYYDNTSHPVVKQKNTPVSIDNTTVVPQSWATAFLYTYTPHLHGNENFFKIYDEWFGQSFPNGSILQTQEGGDAWLIQNGQKRKFASRSVLISRADPKLIITVPESELTNYLDGPEINLSNYSILKAGEQYYLVDYDTVRPFASGETVRKLGYHPQEIIDVTAADLTNYAMGAAISADAFAPQGLIYHITETDTYYLLKENTLRPILNTAVIKTGYKNLPIENKTKNDLKAYPMDYTPVNFRDGSLIVSEGNNYVIEDGKKRLIGDGATFAAMGYKQSNVVAVDVKTTVNIPSGEPIYLRSALLDNNVYFLNKERLVEDKFKTALPAYLVAEYPSGLILAGKNVDARRPIASLTKLFTAYGALQNGFNASGFTAYDSKKYSAYNNYFNFVNGERTRNRDLFNAMLIKSVNNTARMVAQSTGLNETELITRVNQIVRDWGAASTTIADVTGLDPKNVSTPRDLLLVFTELLKNDTIKTALARKEYEFTELEDKNGAAKHTFANSNELMVKTGLNYKILASKTGYLEESGACLIMLVESSATGKQYVLITMGDNNYNKRFDEPDRLARWITDGNLVLADE